MKQTETRSDGEPCYVIRTRVRVSRKLQNFVKFLSRHTLYFEVVGPDHL